MSAFHIKNNYDSHDSFIKAFAAAMRINGFEICGEDDADVFYFLAFGRDNRYVTVSTQEYCTTPERLHKDLKLLSGRMKTVCFSICGESGAFETAERLGIDTEQLLLNYDSLNRTADGCENINIICFRKAEKTEMSE